MSSTTRILGLARATRPRLAGMSGTQREGDSVSFTWTSVETARVRLRTSTYQAAPDRVHANAPSSSLFRRPPDSEQSSWLDIAHRRARARPVGPKDQHNG